MVRQNSATVACRAIVMLGCLIAIPAVALFGTSLPTRLLALCDARWAAQAEADEQSVATSRLDAGRSAGGDAPRFGADTQAGAAAGAASGPPPAEHQKGPIVLPLPGGAGPSDRLVPVGQANPPPLPTAPSSRPAQLGSGDSRFGRIQERLRQLGATYYRLETWGERDELYRFHCRVALAGSSSFSRHFEVTDADPLRAMTRVLEEVEASRAKY